MPQKHVSVIYKVTPKSTKLHLGQYSLFVEKAHYSVIDTGGKSKAIV